MIRLYATAIVLALLLGAIGVQTVRLAREQTSHAKDKAEWARLSLARSEANRFQEQKWQATAQEAERARSQEQKRGARVVAALSAERDGLRESIDLYAAGRGAANDSIDACRSRSATLGALVEDGLRVQDELASGAEALGADLRSMLAFGRGLK